MNLTLKVICFALIACNSANNQQTEQKAPDATVEKTVAEPAVSDTIPYKSPGTKITLKNNSAIVKGSINSGDKPAISFEVSSGTVLSMAVQPVGNNGNVRLNQIQTPDGKLDGPFGSSNDYPISQKGLYTIFLGEDLMGGDPWSGNWVLTITVK